MSRLIHCIYCSRAAQSFTPQDIETLLERSRRNNSAHGITGMLLYVERSFFQVLEGEEPAVDHTFKIIASDPRHYRVTEIIREPLARRNFPDWTMGFEMRSSTELRTLTGENDFFTNPHALETLQPGRAKKLLTVFKHGGWRPDETGVFDSSAGKPA